MSIAPVRNPADVMLELTGRDYLSFSAVATYQACPLQFRFRYIDQLPEKTISASLVFGSAIHACLQFHFQEILSGNPPPDLDTLLGVFQEVWQGQQVRVQFAKGENINALGRLAELVLLSFQASALANPTGALVGIEEEFRAALIPGCPDLLARVDLVVDTADALVLTDFKTSRSGWSRDKAEQSSEQLLLYHELAKPLANGKPLRLEFAVLTKSKQPRIDVHRVPVSAHHITRSKKIVETVWKSIQAGFFYPAPSPIVCSTCPFKRPCRAWGG